MCILNNAGKLCGYDQYPVSFLSAHDLIFVCLQARIARLPSEIVKRCDFRKLHNESFLRDLYNCDWDKFVESNGEDKMVTSLNRNLVSVLDRHAPVRAKSQRFQLASWLNNYIFQKMKECDRVRRAWRKHRKPELHKLFKALRNRVQSLIRDAKENYYQNVFSLKRDTVSTWSELRRLGLIGSSAGKNRCNLDLDELNAAFILSIAAGFDTESGDLNWHPDDSDLERFNDAHFFFADISSKALRDAIFKGGPLPFLKQWA